MAESKKFDIGKMSGRSLAVILGGDMFASGLGLTVLPIVGEIAVAALAVVPLVAVLEYMRHKDFNNALAVGLIAGGLVALPLWLGSIIGVIAFLLANQGKIKI